MINEAVKTLVLLKGTLDQLQARKIDPDSAQRRLRNFSRVNGLEWTHRTEQAVARFTDAATHFTAGGDAMNFQATSDREHRANYEAAVDALRDYRDALRGARIREDARMIGSADETEVDEPNF